MRFDEKIRMILKKPGLTNLAFLAKKSGIPYSSLVTYVSGKTRKEPPASRGLALAKALNVDAHWLFDDNKGMPPVPYHEPPPFELFPWPPTISWDELSSVLRRYQDQRIDAFNKVITALAEGQEISIQPLKPNTDNMEKKKKR